MRMCVHECCGTSYCCSNKATHRSDFPVFFYRKSWHVDMNSLFLPHCVILQLNHSGNKQLGQTWRVKSGLCITALFCPSPRAALPLQPNSYLVRTCVWRIWLPWTLDYSEGRFVYLKDFISSQVWTQEGTRAGKTRLRETAHSPKGCFAFVHFAGWL